MTTEGPILFYDGQCGFCARTVQWCLRQDHRGALRFAPLQGATFASLDIPDKPTGLDTMALLEGGRLSVRGDAVLVMLRHLGGLWPAFAGVGHIIPRSLRDAAYRCVARHRDWFGTAESCRLPSARDRARFLP